MPRAIAKALPGAVNFAEAMGSPALMAVAGAAAEGTMVASFFNPDDPATAVVGFKAAFTAKYGVPSDAGTALGYDGVRLLAHAMKEAASAVPENLARTSARSRAGAA